MDKRPLIEKLEKGGSPIMHFFTFMFTMVFILGSSVNVQAKQINGIVFADNYEDEGVSMSLKGVGRKWVLFMKVFAAGFYLEDGVSVEDALKNVSKRIEVSYYHPVPRRKLNNYTVKIMKKNMTKREFESVSEKVDIMSDYFVDLKPGDHYSLTYLPEIGTKFAYNGELVGIIEGEKFAKGLFAVWVGEKPMDKRIKKQILGIDSGSDEEFEMALSHQP